MNTPWTFDRMVDLIYGLASLATWLGGIAVTLGILFFGVRMAISRDNASGFQEAKNGLIKVAVGALIIFGAWTIIATIQGAVNSIGK